MNRTNRFIFGLVVAFLTALSPLVAQSNAKGIASASFTCVIWESLGLDEIYYLEKEDHYEPLKFRRGTRSALFPLSAQQSLKLYTQREVEGELVYDLVGEGKLPSGTRQILFLVSKNEKSSGLPLQILGIDDSTNSLPAGSYKIVNFTNTQLELRINETTDRVKPRSMKVVKPEIPQKGGFLPFYLGDRNEGVLYETRLYCQKNGREMVFVFPSSGNRSISVKFLSQLVGKQTEEKGIGSGRVN